MKPDPFGGVATNYYKHMRKEDPTRCYLLFYYTYNMLNMFQAPLCPSSGAHDYTIAK
jgi:hypothetical protein